MSIEYQSLLGYGANSCEAGWSFQGLYIHFCKALFLLFFNVLFVSLLLERTVVLPLCQRLDDPVTSRATCLDCYRIQTIIKIIKK